MLYWCFVSFILPLNPQTGSSKHFPSSRSWIALIHISEAIGLLVVVGSRNNLHQRVQSLYEAPISRDKDGFSLKQKHLTTFKTDTIITAHLQWKRMRIGLINVYPQPGDHGTGGTAWRGVTLTFLRWLFWANHV